MQTRLEEATALDIAIRITETRVTNPIRPEDSKIVRHRLEGARGTEGTADRRVTVSGWINDDDLSKPRLILRELGAIDVPLADSPTNRAKLEDLLRADIAARKNTEEATTNIDGYQQTGWTDTAEGPAYLLPKGSIGSTHAVADINNPLKDHLSIKHGDLNRAMPALRDALATVSNEGLTPIIGVLAAQIAIATGLHPVGALFVDGPSQIGKTATMLAMVASGNHGPLGVNGQFNCDSTVGALRSAYEGTNDAIVVIDDARDTDPGNANANREIKTAMDGIMRVAYSGGIAGRARLDTGREANYGMKSPDSAHPLIMILSEVEPQRFTKTAVSAESRLLRLPFPENSANDRGRAIAELSAAGHLQAILHRVIAQTLPQVKAAKRVEKWRSMQKAAHLQRIEESPRCQELSTDRMKAWVTLLDSGAGILADLAHEHGVDLDDVIETANAGWLEAARAGDEVAKGRVRSSGIALIRRLKELVAAGSLHLDAEGGGGIGWAHEVRAPGTREPVIALLPAVIAERTHGAIGYEEARGGLLAIKGAAEGRGRDSAGRTEKKRQVRAILVPLAVWQQETEAPENPAEEVPAPPETGF